MTDYGYGVDATLQAVLADGEKALRRIDSGSHFDDWVAVGRGLSALRTIAMQRAYTNTPAGKPYNTEFSKLLEKSPYKSIGKAPRAILLQMMSEIDAIIAWRATLPEEQLRGMSYPKTVLKHWRSHCAAEAEARRIAEGGEPIEKRPSPVAVLKAVNAELVEENDRLTKQAAGGSHFDYDRDTPANIAKVMVGVSVSRAKKVHAALGKAIAAAEKARTK